MNKISQRHVQMMITAFHGIKQVFITFSQREKGFHFILVEEICFFMEVQISFSFYFLEHLIFTVLKCWSQNCTLIFFVLDSRHQKAYLLQTLVWRNLF